MYQLKPKTIFWPRLTLIVAVLIVCAVAAAAQSTSLDFPAPVTTNQITGAIDARDIGDARTTKYYYLLTGTTGDLNLKVQYTNLNGDIDLFTADTMRPLAKVSLVASDYPVNVERTVFLRIHENLILRIDARSSNDDPGRYRIDFSGTFEALAPNPEAPPEAPVVTEKNTANNRRRVTSAGEVIIEPEPPTVAKVEPPKPVATTATAVRPKTHTPARTPRNTRTGIGGSTTGSNTTTGSKPTGRKAPIAKPASTETATNTGTTEEKPAGDKTAASKPNTTARKTGNTRRNTPARNAPSPASPDPMANARLVVETRDGMRQEHYLRDVRRFSVENGLLVVILKDGKIERQAMSNILKVTIEP